MTSLSCRFADKFRFYDQVLKEDLNHIFVPTEQSHAAGAEVEIAIFIGDAERPIPTRGNVLGPGESPGVGEGVWVELPRAQADALRERVQLEDGDVHTTTVRAHLRVPRDLQVSVVTPVRAALRTLNVSEGGACLVGAPPAKVGDTITLRLPLGGEDLEVEAEVRWRREDAGQTGISFNFPDESMRQQVAERLRELDHADERVIYGRPTILAVDDDLAVLQAFNRTLSIWGYGTLTASTGLEAIALARENSPALIVLDVMLLGMNGLEICRVLKRDAETSRIPVVLTSGMAKGQLRLILEESGALGALPKPFMSDTLETLVEDVFDCQASLNKNHYTDAPDERRGQRRLPAFLRAFYASDTLRVETNLRDVSLDGGFLVSFWGDPTGTRATLTLPEAGAQPLVLDVEVARRSDWGIADGTHVDGVPGMAVRFHEGPGRDALARWMTLHEANMQGKPVIVVVDDDRAHRQLLTEILGYAGYSVVALEGVFGLRDAIALAKPSLVILDFMMPGMDGSELCMLLKSDKRTSDLTVWLYSSLSLDRLKALVDESGADGYLQKGMRPSEIVAAVDEIVKR